MGLAERLRETFRSNKMSMPSFDNTLLREALLQSKGKSYYTTFDLGQSEREIATEDVLIRPRDSDVMIGERHNDGMRDFNNPTVRYHMDTSGTGFSEEFLSQYREKKKTGIITDIHKGQKSYQEKYPVLMDVYSVLMDSIVQEGKKFYSRDMQEPMAKFIDAERFVSEAIDALSDPSILEAMVFQNGGIANDAMKKRLSRRKELLDRNDELDIGKVKDALGDLSYLNDDHERKGKEVFLSEEGKEFCKVGIMKGIFGKNRWYQRKTPMKAVEEAYRDAIEDLEDELYMAFRYGPKGEETAANVWSILTYRPLLRDKAERENLLSEYDHDGVTGQDIERILQDHYRAERRNEGEEKVGYHSQEKNDTKPITVDKIRGFSQLVDEYDRRKEALDTFRLTYLESDAGSVYDHVKQVVGLSPFSKTRGTEEENPNLMMMRQIESNLTEEWPALEEFMEGTKNKKKVLLELNKKMGETYVQARKHTYMKEGFPEPDESVFGLPAPKKMDRQYIDSLWKNLMFGDYTGNSFDERTGLIRKFAAYKNLADIIQVP